MIHFRGNDITYALCGNDLMTGGCSTATSDEKLVDCPRCRKRIDNNARKAALPVHYEIVDRGIKRQVCRSSKGFKRTPNLEDVTCTTCLRILNTKRKVNDRGRVHFADGQLSLCGRSDLKMSDKIQDITCKRCLAIYG